MRLVTLITIQIKLYDSKLFLSSNSANLTINNIPKQLIKNSSETIYWLKRNWI